MSADISTEALIQSAVEARDLAVAPYSDYKVGAALLSSSGKIFTAGNIESSSYSLTMCAERVALYSALSGGYREFLSIGVATDNGASPCGACRQLLWEFARDIQVILIDSGSNYREISLADLLPEPFDDNSLHT
jgi:cytidine deaminase